MTPGGTWRPLEASEGASAGIGGSGGYLASSVALAPSPVTSGGWLAPRIPG